MFGDIQKLAGSEVFPPCGALWQPVATCGCCESMHCFIAISRNCCEASCTFLQLNILGFGSFWRLLWIHYWWFGISKKLLRRNLQTFTKNYLWFWKLQDADANPLLMVWKLNKVVVIQVTHFYKKYWWLWKLQEAAVNPLLMVWHKKEVAVKPFAKF